MNVGRTDAQGNHRMAGRYTAVHANFPLWSSVDGWRYDGINQQSTIGYIPPNNQSISAIVRYANPAKTAAYKVMFGVRFSDVRFWGFQDYESGTTYRYSPAAGQYYWYVNRSIENAGMIAICGNQSYRYGVNDGITLSAGDGAGFGKSFAFGSGNGERYFAVDILAAVIVGRILSPAETWYASRQMAYCGQNPDWNVWARRRMYFYAPSAVFQAAWAARTNTLIGGGLN